MLMINLKSDFSTTGSHFLYSFSFDLAEEELKNLVQKLQDAMPSIHDQETVRRQDTKKPIYSVSLYFNLK